jgi:uncharacterized membrane protein
VKRETPTTKLRPRDVAELAIGGMIMAMPMAVTAEVWVLSQELGLGRALLIALITIAITAVFVWALLYHEVTPLDRRHFRRRVLAAYTIALLISALMLLSIDRLPLLDDPVLALKRTILVAVAVSFGATTADSLLSSR